jgi:hypothetical protein
VDLGDRVAAGCPGPVVELGNSWAEQSRNSTRTWAFRPTAPDLEVGRSLPAKTPGSGDAVLGFQTSASSPLQMALAAAALSSGGTTQRVVGHRHQKTQENWETLPAPTGSSQPSRRCSSVDNELARHPGTAHLAEPGRRRRSSRSGQYLVPGRDASPGAVLRWQSPSCWKKRTRPG